MNKIRSDVMRAPIPSLQKQDQPAALHEYQNIAKKAK